MKIHKEKLELAKISYFLFTVTLNSHFISLSLSFIDVISTLFILELLDHFSLIITAGSSANEQKEN